VALLAKSLSIPEDSLRRPRNLAGEVPISFAASAAVRRFPVSTGGLLPFKGPAPFRLRPTG